MGNQESSTSESEIAERDERKSQQQAANNYESDEDGKPGLLQEKQTNNIEYLSYDDIYVEENEDIINLDEADEEGSDEEMAPSILPSMLVNVLSDDPVGLTSKMRNGPNPAFDDNWEVKLAKVQLPRTVIECQLYECINGKREQLCSEGSVSLSEINPRIKNQTIVRLHPRFVAPSVHTAQSIDHETVDYDAWTEVTESSRCTKTMSITPSETGTLVTHPRSVVQQQPGRVQFTNETKVTETPTEVHRQPTSAEVLLSASYNATTGKFECLIQKAHGLYRPGRSAKAPSCYVQIMFSDNEGKEFVQGVTQTVKRTTTPVFHEVLVFNVPKDLTDKVTMQLTVYHKQTTGKKQGIGLILMGKRNSSDTEKEHWEEIIDGHGQRIARWHKLYLA
ncbi:Synaptotagmin-16 [Clonorchis sinensis]|uniref:Synaptotagmin-16 n=1 Tax=Clonorchis sinensis TaxID=79923 RepID=A0A8T1MUR2_CLOSI|nr:Synaptotagmin-16 [Clonorchis sinensis]